MNLDYMLIYHKSAVKFIAKLEKTFQERIVTGLKGLLSIPPEGDIKSLKGHTGLYRLRIGSFRVIFTIDHKEQVIISKPLETVEIFINSLYSFCPKRQCLEQQFSINRKLYYRLVG